MNKESSIEYDLNTLPEAINWLQELIASNGKKIMVRGEMGSGKTTLIKAYCKHLNCEGNLSSPTFSLINEYEYLDKSGAAKLIYHMDLYRLNDLEEALNIGIEEYLANEHLMFIEWPELIESIAPMDALQLQIEIIDDSKRKIISL